MAKHEIELDEAQEQALAIYGARLGLTNHEMVQFAVLSQIDAAIRTGVNPEATHEEWIALSVGADHRLAHRIKDQRQ